MKTAIITGISSDMAQALASSLEDDGWRVVGVSRTEVDLANLAAVQNYASKLAGEIDQVDAVVHFAGIWHEEDRAMAGMQLGKFSPEEVAAAINVGLTSMMVLVTSLMPKFGPEAAIIGISGTFADGGAGWVPYFVSKRAQEDFLVGLAQDYAGTLRVYGISPSDTATEPYKKFYPEYAADGQTPATVADLAERLILDKTSYKSGDIIKLERAEESNGYHV